MSAHGMACPHCGQRGSRCIDSRPVGDSAVRRRRDCDNCDALFTTYEVDKATFDVLMKIRTGEFQSQLLQRTNELLDLIEPFRGRGAG